MKPIYAGQRYTAKNRRSGTVISVYDAFEQGIDAAGEWVVTGVTPVEVWKPWRWATVCEEHGAVIGHKTLWLAREWMACPDWCDECQEIMREREETGR